MALRPPVGVGVEGEADEARWAATVRAHGSWLRRYLAARLPADAVEDVLQDVWLAWWAMRERYEEQGRLAAYLRRLAERRAADWLRRRAAAGSGKATAAPAAAPEPDVAADLLRSAGVGRNSLLWERVVADRSLAALAADHGLPLGTVKSRLHHEGRAARQRLDDWLRQRSGACGGLLHHRALGVAPCARCLPAWRVWQALNERAAGVDWFQASHFTVASDLSVWCDADGWFGQGVRGAPTLNISGPLELGPVRLLTNARGEDMRRRLRIVAAAGRLWWAFPVRPEDGRRLRISHRAAAPDVGASEVVARFGRGFELRTGLTLPRGGDRDASISVQLPVHVRLAHVDPSPTEVHESHGRALLVWQHAGRLARSPVVVGHWR